MQDNDNGGGIQQVVQEALTCLHKALFIMDFFPLEQRCSTNGYKGCYV